MSETANRFWRRTSHQCAFVRHGHLRAHMTMHRGTALRGRCWPPGSIPRPQCSVGRPYKIINRRSRRGKLSQGGALVVGDGDRSISKFQLISGEAREHISRGPLHLETATNLFPRKLISEDHALEIWARKFISRGATCSCHH
jgi:hypothetical protein